MLRSFRDSSFAVAVITAGGEGEELEATLYLRFPFLCSVKKYVCFMNPVGKMF